MLTSNNFMGELIEQESLRSRRDADNGIERDSSIGDPLQGLEEFLTTDTNRLNLKWVEARQGRAEERKLSKNLGKILVGTNTYLPLGDRACFSLDIPIPQPESASSSSFSSSNSARELLFRLISKTVILSPYVEQLDLEGFGTRRIAGKRTKDRFPCITLDIEDVFEAFAGNKSSTWRNGCLSTIRTWDCDMNSHRGNHLFDLADDEYPMGLEYVYVHSPRGGVVSSSIFKITTNAPKLHRLYIFRGQHDDNEDDSDGDNDNDNGDNDNNNNNDNDANPEDGNDGHDDNANESDENDANEGGVFTNNTNRTTERVATTSIYKPNRFNGSRLTPSSIEAICEVLSSRNQLLEMNQLPFRELLQLPETDFRQILRATATTRTPAAVSRREPLVKQLDRRTELRFPVDRNTARTKMTSNLTILATRSEALRFYLLWKRSLEVLRDTEKRSLYPLVLEKSQERKSMLQWISCNQIDLLYAMLQDSLESMLKGVAA